jgi:monooxygenase
MEHVDIAVVGASVTALGYLKYIGDTEIPFTYVVLEGEGDVGGTWLKTRYPGIRSDSDAYTMCFGFKPYTGDSTFISGEDFQTYLREYAEESGIHERIRFHARVLSCHWDSAGEVWTIRYRSGDHTDREVTASHLINAAGYLSVTRMNDPHFDNESSFEGEIFHANLWPEGFDCSGRKVAVIGSGAAAVTLIPPVAETSEALTLVQRSPGYILAWPRRDPVDVLLSRALPLRWSNPLIRLKWQLTRHGFYYAARAVPRVIRALLLFQVWVLLGSRRGELFSHFKPRYRPWDQRLCAAPDGDMFRALRMDTVSVQTGEVARIEPKGLTMQDGTFVECDVIIKATGNEAAAGGGVPLYVDGEKVQISERLAFCGTMLERVPNYFMMGGIIFDTYTTRVEVYGEFIARLLAFMRSAGHRVVCPVPSTRPHRLISMLGGLDSNYVKRSASRFPLIGDRFPWAKSENHWVARRALRGLSFDHEDLRFE